MRRIIFLFLILVLVPGACSRQPEAVPDPIPAMTWHEVEVSPFRTKAGWAGKPVDPETLTSAFRAELKMPDALETRLLRDDREVWKNVLASVELAEQHRRNGEVMANQQIPGAVTCAPPGSAFSLNQRASLSRMLQQHRNVLWHIGRLEMTTRYIKTNLRQFLPQYATGHIEGAEAGVVGPVHRMAAQLFAFQNAYPTPNGVWSPGEFHFRMARTAQPAQSFVEARNAFAAWKTELSVSPQWQYLADTADAPLAGFQMWAAEFDELITAFRHLTSSIQSLEQSFAPPHGLVAFPCINQNLKRLRILSGLYNSVLPMQWALIRARQEAVRVRDRITPDAYNAGEYLSAQIDETAASLAAQLQKLERASDLLLMLWDETSYRLWEGLPEFLDPIHHHSSPAVQDAETWLTMYNQVQADIKAVTATLRPEPEQPLNRRGKPFAPPVQKIIEELNSPSRIDDVEHGLLAISELEAHLLSVRDQLMRLCIDGACRSFPEAELPHSPRNSSWVVSWRQAPVSERSLGHSIIVLKLCQLHLARLVQRLTEIYAWFAETSNADITWKALKSWQRIWTLYAEPNGTYASFLRSVAELDSQITGMARPQANRAQSPEILELLSLQTDLFDLTIDYARFIDGQAPPPVPFDNIMDVWEQIETALNTIARLTAERDRQNAPEDEIKPRRVRKDIDR